MYDEIIGEAQEVYPSEAPEEAPVIIDGWNVDELSYRHMVETWIRQQQEEYKP
jgi:hypothetical protein